MQGLAGARHGHLVQQVIQITLNRQLASRPFHRHREQLLQVGLERLENRRGGHETEALGCVEPVLGDREAVILIRGQRSLTLL